jgi:hypothetical protein
LTHPSTSDYNTVSRTIYSASKNVVVIPYLLLQRMVAAMPPTHPYRRGPWGREVQHRAYFGRPGYSHPFDQEIHDESGCGEEWRSKLISNDRGGTMNDKQKPEKHSNNDKALNNEQPLRESVIPGTGIESYTPTISERDPIPDEPPTHKNK